MYVYFFVIISSYFFINHLLDQVLDQRGGPQVPIYVLILWRSSSHQDAQNFQLSAVTYVMPAVPHLAVHSLHHLADVSQFAVGSNVVQVVKFYGNFVELTYLQSHHGSNTR